MGHAQVAEQLVGATLRSHRAERPRYSRVPARRSPAATAPPPGPGPGLGNTPRGGRALPPPATRAPAPGAPVAAAGQAPRAGRGRLPPWPAAGRERGCRPGRLRGRARSGRGGAKPAEIQLFVVLPPQKSVARQAALCLEKELLLPIAFLVLLMLLVVSNAPSPQCCCYY